MDGLGRQLCFVVPALPQFLTFTLYGKQFVKGRILEESLYAQDPIHPTRESNVVAIFERGTSLKVESVDIDAVKSGCLLHIVQEAVDRGAQFLIFDAVSDKDCRRIFETLYSAYPKALWAGTLGLLGGITDTFYGMEEQENIPKRELRCACFSGTTYDVTRQQIHYCEERGMKVVPLDIRKCLNPETCQTELEHVAHLCRLANEESDFTVVPEAGGLENDYLSEKILKFLTVCAEFVLQNVQADRIIIIGGETANAIFHQLKVRKLLIREKPETGVAAGTFLDGVYAGTEFAAKGGSVGTVEALYRMTGKE